MLRAFPFRTFLLWQLANEAVLCVAEALAPNVALQCLQRRTANLGSANLLHCERSRGKQLQQRARWQRWIEPVRPLGAIQDDDLSVRVRLDIWPRRHGEHGKGLAHVGR